MKFKPVGDNILIKVDPAQTQKGSIVIPDAVAEAPVTATVVALGTHRFTDTGMDIPFDVRVDDRIYITKFCGIEITINGEAFKVINSDDILGIIT